MPNSKPSIIVSLDSETVISSTLLLPLFLVVRRIGDRKSSWIVRCRLGVRGVRGGSIIGGSIGGRTSGLGTGKAISSFPGRRRVFGAIAGRNGPLFWRSKVGDAEAIVKKVLKSSRFRNIYHWLGPLLVTLLLEDSMVPVPWPESLQLQHLP